MNETFVKSPEAMMQVGAAYAKKAKAGDVFGLVGTLGTGKTHWTKGFMQELDPEKPVSSPTFSIVNEYPVDSRTVFHFDFYRLESAEELIALGWDEYLEEFGIVICEWADLFPELMPEHTTWLRITHEADAARKIEKIEPPEKRSAGET